VELNGLESGSPWVVAQTKSRHEKAFAEDLERLGIPYFLPLSKTVRYYGRRKFRVELPLFSGYVFFKADRESAIQADRTKRVVRLLSVADQATLDRQLSVIREAIARGATMLEGPALADGETVEITAGPFKGLSGVVHSRAQLGRIVLNVDLIGRAAILELDSVFVRPI
jgi:transcription antitermination factor NusG